MPPNTFISVDLPAPFPPSNPCLLYTSRIPGGSKIPLIMDNDRQAIRAGVRCCFDTDQDHPRIVHIHNTLCLDEFYISESMLPEALKNPNIDVMGKPEEYYVFNESGNLF